jgi:N-succinyldiaminopimelate aminotransferase
MTLADRERAGASLPRAGARSPFVRLAALLADIAPGKAAINLALGEPQHPIPPFVGSVIAAHLAQFGRYPPGKGTERFRRAAALWLGRRFALPRALDPETEVVVLNGTREGLFLAALVAKGWVTPRAGRPAILLPNPFYAVYAAGAAAADCEPVYLDATLRTGFLPDLESIDTALLSRTVALYLASPSNPQGAVADRHYLGHAAALAQRFGFLLMSDECYAEIYGGEPPPGVLEAAGPDFANVVVFHSLSKRSNLPGLRVGFAAGDRRFMTSYGELRNIAAPQVPGPAQEVAVTALADEAHVAANRRLYAAKFALADEILGARYGYRHPAGGFFLWLDVRAQGGGEAAAVALWRQAGLRVLPGRYIAHDQIDGTNPGADFIRVAMVQDQETTAEALHRLVAVLG